MRSAIVAFAGLCVATVMVASSCGGSFCLTSDQCGDTQLCIGNVCRDSATNPTGDDDIVGRADGGASSSSSGGSSSSAGDGGVVGSDGGTFTISLTAQPTALVVNETGNELWVATNASQDNGHVERYTLPYSPTVSARGLDLVDNVSGRCEVQELVVRGNFAYAGCGGLSFQSIRPFSVTSGQVDGFPESLTAPFAANDQTNMLVMAAAANGTGAAAFTSPNAAPAARAQWEQQQMNVGIGIVETPAVTSAILQDPSGPTQLLLYRFADGTFSSSAGGIITIAGFQSVTRITSGRFNSAITPSQPVIVVDGTGGTATLWDGRALEQGLNATPAPVREYTGVALPSPSSNPRFKIRRDSRYAYFISTGSQLCRLSLTETATTPACLDLPAGCSPVDVAPSVAGSPTFVACRATPYKVHAVQGF